VGLFDDGNPGEVQITMDKNTATVTGLLESLSKLITLSLQYGVSLATLVKEFENQRFEPNGSTKSPEIQHASSVIDYVFRWLGFQFLPGYREANMPKKLELAMSGLDDEIKKLINVAQSSG
jgi:ribonucleoside-diphosphate reductase alpha chain